MKVNICCFMLSIIITVIISGCKSDDGNPVTAAEPGAVYYGGKNYHPVVIGSQTWLRENLDIGTMIQANQNPGNNSTIEKYCYNNDADNCALYGGLYQWNEAMGYVLTPGAKGICPDGYHIPTREEFDLLILEIGNNSTALKASGQGLEAGAGTNTSGFSALLGGIRAAAGNSTVINQMTFFWHSNASGEDMAHTTYMYNHNNIIYPGLSYKESGFSIRCIKN